MELYGSGGSIIVDQREADVVQHMLLPGEKIACTIKQRTMGPGGDMLTPTTLVATDKRLIIVYRTAMGMRKYYEVIPYRRITSVRIEHGLISSSLHLNILGVDKTKAMHAGKEEGVIDGLREKEAAEFGKFINHKIMDVSSDISAGNDTSDVDNKLVTSMFCRSCGAKELSSSKFCRNCGASLQGKS
ncbi:MAG: PH domain-containing protein [Candidatus Micrarchaeales archaeon]